MLPPQVIERLFERLAVVYGREFLSMYDSLDPAAVKASWSNELAGFTGNLDAIAWALANLPTRAPNAIAFRALCRQAPPPPAPALPAPDVKADPARVAAALESFDRTRFVPGDRRSWARRIAERVQAGEPVPFFSRKAAASVLARSQGVTE